MLRAADDRGIVMMVEKVGSAELILSLQRLTVLVKPMLQKDSLPATIYRPEGRRKSGPKIAIKSYLWIDYNMDSKHSTPTRRVSALTLIEVLVTMAVVAILAMLLANSISQANGKAKRTLCASNLRQLGFALNGFIADNQVYPLFPPWITSLGREGLGSSKAVDYRAGIWVCPSARWNINAFPTNWVPSCYGYNGYGLFNIRYKDETLGLGGNNSKGFLAMPTRELDVLNPSDMMAIGDSLGGSILFARENLERVQAFSNSSTRHQGKGNVVFCDGHIEAVTLSYLNEATNDNALARWNRDHRAHRERLTP